MSSRAFGQALILVIDESDAVLAATRATLEAAGFRVITQARAAGAVAVILHEKPDLVLIDLTVPSPGADLIGRLFGREQPSSETTLLLHSSLPEDAARARAFASGAHGHVSKNDDSFEFLRRINQWLKQGLRTSHSKLRAVSRPDLPAVNEEPSARASSQSFASSGKIPIVARVPPARTSGTMRLDLPTVLFIDDDMGTLSGFRREVQSEPYSVEFALSGPRAIERIRSSAPPDVVVSDLLMPEPAGPEIYRQAIASDPTWQGRFVFVTGAALMLEVAGFLDQFRGIVLYKPVAGQDLRAAIRRALGDRLAARSGAVQDGNPR